MKTLYPILLTLLVTSGLAVSYATSNAKAEMAIGIGVYWDSACNNPVSSVNWGQILSGATSSKNVFVRNEGNVPLTLSLATTNWNPPETANFATLSWDHGGQAIEPNQIVPIVLSLHASPYVQENTVLFGFDAVISATGSATISIMLSMMGSIILSEPPPLPEFPGGSMFLYLAATPLLFYLWRRSKKKNLQ